MSILPLEDFGGNRDCGVDRVGDDCSPGGGAVLGNGLCQVTHYARIYVEQVVPRHPRLAGHTSGDERQVAAIQRLPQRLLAHITLDLSRASCKLCAQALLVQAK